VRQLGARAEKFLASALFVCITGAAISNSPELSELFLATTFGPFSSREVASAVTLLAFFLWALVKSADVRRSLRALAPSTRFLTKWILVVLLYYAVIVSILFYLEVWHTGLTVPTSLWILTVGIVSAFKGMSGREQPPSLKAAVSASLIAGWFVSLYTFSFIIELVYQPMIALIAGVAVFSEKESAATKNAISIIYTVLGLMAFTPSIVGLIQQPVDRGYIESLLLPIIGFFTVLPLAHGLSLYSLYEGIGIRLNLYSASDDVCKYALLRTLRHFHVRRAALEQFRTAAARDLFWAQSRAEVDEAFRKHG